MKAPRVLSVTAVLVCHCGEQFVFDGLEDGWQHIWPCLDCGRRVSFQIDSIAQYDRSDA